MRFLRPGWLIPFDTGLWLIDEFQPVAAILDPRSGAVRDVVSWAELPPAPISADRLDPTVLSDGTSLWTQQERTGPLLRIGPDGDHAAVWTDGLQLAACGPGEAWCAPLPPRQELLNGAAAQPMAVSDSGLSPLLRVRVDGRQDTIWIDRPIRAVHAAADALVVTLDDDPWRLHHLGTETYEVVRTSRYLSIPWGGELPSRLSATADILVAERPAGIRTPPHAMSMTWYETTPDPRAILHAAGLRWRLGRVSDAGGEATAPWFPVLATAHDDSDAVVARFELGAGSIVTARSIAGDAAVGVAVRRPGSTHPVEVLSLRPGRDVAETLLAADAIDISKRCWPLVPRPVEADSYAARILADNSSLQTYWNGADGVGPLVDGMSDVTTGLAGGWPDTHLVWTFRWTQRPGLILRRRVPLYDELGRIIKPEFADIHLMERLHTGGIAPASAADNGILDI